MKTIDIARKYLGIKEVKGNQGFVISTPEHAGFEAKMRSVGWKPGLSWCMFLQKLIAEEAAGHSFKELNGGVHSSWQNVQKSGNFVVSQSPILGGIAFWDSDGAHGHAGMPIAYSGAKIVTIEGNTNKAGSRDGDGVLTQLRQVSPKHSEGAKLELLGYAIAKELNENDQSSVQPS